MLSELPINTLLKFFILRLDDLVKDCPVFSYSLNKNILSYLTVGLEVIFSKFLSMDSPLVSGKGFTKEGLLLPLKLK
jgi:flagellar biosynthesis protein FliR